MDGPLGGDNDGLLSSLAVMPVGGLMMHGMGRYDDEGREGRDGQDDHNGAKYGSICGQLRRAHFMLNNHDMTIHEKGVVQTSTLTS